MDELDLIKRLRADVKEPDLQRMDAAWREVLERLGPEGPARAPRVGPDPRRRRALAGVAASTVLLLAIILPSILPVGSPGGPDSAEAARVLRRLAIVAADRPAPPAPRADQYVYTRSESFHRYTYALGDSDPSWFSFDMPETREAWIAPNGEGRIRSASGKATFPTPQDRAAWISAGSPDLWGGETADESFEGGGLTFLDLASLPTDPEELLTLIEEREVVGGPGGDWETYVIVGDLLRETYARPELRAALFEVAANLPDTEFVGQVHDLMGRPGIAIAHTVNGLREELIFDPETAELLGERTVVVDPDEIGLGIGPETFPGTIYGGWGERGTVVSSTAYVVSGLVEST